MLADAGGNEAFRPTNPAERLLPVISYLETSVERAWWPKCPGVNEMDAEYAGRMRKAIARESVGDFADLVSHFAQAVRAAAEGDIKIKVPDMADDCFEQRLHGKSETLAEIFKGVTRIGVDEAHVRSRQKQINQLVDAQIDMIHAIEAYDNAKARRIAKNNAGQL